MPVRAQIEAATGTERLRLKAQAFVDLLGNVTERSFTLPNGWTATIASSSLKLLNGTPALRFLLTVTRPNGNVQFNDECVVINPPILVRGTDADGNLTLTEDLRAVLRDIVRGVVVR